MGSIAKVKEGDKTESTESQNSYLLSKQKVELRKTASKTEKCDNPTCYA